MKCKRSALPRPPRPLPRDHPRVPRRRRKQVGRRASRKRPHLQRLKRQRARHILARQRHQRQAQRAHRRTWTLATWNTRGLGAVAGYINQELKTKCFLDRMFHQGWGCVVVTDLKFPDDAVRTYRQHGQAWHLVVCQQVGFLLTAQWWTWWQAGGSVCYRRSSRVAALGFPRVGWCRGLYLIGVYAPISTAGQASRLAVRRDVELLMALAPATHLVLILGGLNAELGNNHAGLGSCGRFCQPQGLGDWSGMEGLVLPPRSPGCL